MLETSLPRTSSQQLAPVADYFKVLSEVSRLMVLDVLRQTGVMNVTEIAEATGLGQANLSKHLKVLTQAGILLREPQGVTVYYKIADPVIFDLCELVCDRVKERVRQQAANLHQFQAFHA